MNGDKLLTVKEFAEITGVSVQSVYKKINSLNHSIQQFVVELNGVKNLKYEAVEWYQSQKENNNPGTAKATSDQAVIEILKQQIDILNQQITEKDKQIASLLEQLQSITVIIDQQQKLTALNQTPQLPEQAEANQEKPKKRKWWSRKDK